MIIIKNTICEYVLQKNFIFCGMNEFKESKLKVRFSIFLSKETMKYCSIILPITNKTGAKNIIFRKMFWKTHDFVEHFPTLTSLISVESFPTKSR